jgi:hypothetical protein
MIISKRFAMNQVIHDERKIFHLFDKVNEDFKKLESYKERRKVHKLMETTSEIQHFYITILKNMDQVIRDSILTQRKIIRKFRKILFVDIKVVKKPLYKPSKGKKELRTGLNSLRKETDELNRFITILENNLKIQGRAINELIREKSTFKTRMKLGENAYNDIKTIFRDARLIKRYSSQETHQERTLLKNVRRISKELNNAKQRNEPDLGKLGIDLLKDTEIIKEEMKAIDNIVLLGVKNTLNIHKEAEQFMEESDEFLKQGHADPFPLIFKHQLTKIFDTLTAEIKKLDNKKIRYRRWLSSDIRKVYQEKRLIKKLDYNQ